MICVIASWLHCVSGLFAVRHWMPQYVLSHRKDETGRLSAVKARQTLITALVCFAVSVILLLLHFVAAVSEDMLDTKIASTSAPYSEHVQNISQHLKASLVHSASTAHNTTAAKIDYWWWTLTHR